MSQEWVIKGDSWMRFLELNSTFGWKKIENRIFMINKFLLIFPHRNFNNGQQSFLVSPTTIPVSFLVRRYETKRTVHIIYQYDINIPAGHELLRTKF